LRAFELTDQLDEDIFDKSPREIDESQYDTIYAKSKKHTIIHKADKIDFFISHSWAEEEADVKAAKRKVLVQFAIDFKNKKGRWPLCWLDKYCINQRDSANDLR
jgi:hypothetical protein